MKKAAACLIVNEQTKMILVVWNPNLRGWCLPGGKVDPGETPIEAAVRELREETGLIAQTENLRPFYEATSAGDPDYFTHIFRALSYSGTPRMTEKDSPTKWTTALGLILDGCYRDYYEAMFRARGFLEGVIA